MVLSRLRKDPAIDAPYEILLLLGRICATVYKVATGTYVTISATAAGRRAGFPAGDEDVGKA
jgi:hypothetical protein